MLKIQNNIVSLKATGTFPLPSQWDHSKLGKNPVSNGLACLYTYEKTNVFAKVYFTLLYKHQ